MTANERGAGTLLVGYVALVVMILTSIGIMTSAYAIAAHRARGAADLAALAAAHSYGSGGQPCSSAKSVAAANGAELTSCEVVGGRSAFAIRVVAQVDVRLHIPAAPTTVTASARAGTPAG